MYRVISITKGIRCQRLTNGAVDKVRYGDRKLGINAKGKMRRVDKGTGVNNVFWCCSTVLGPTSTYRPSLLKIKLGLLGGGDIFGHSLYYRYMSWFTADNPYGSV